MCGTALRAIDGMQMRRLLPREPKTLPGLPHHVRFCPTMHTVRKVLFQNLYTAPRSRHATRHAAGACCFVIQASRWQHGKSKRQEENDALGTPRAPRAGHQREPSPRRGPPAQHPKPKGARRPGYLHLPSLCEATPAKPMMHARRPAEAEPFVPQPHAHHLLAFDIITAMFLFCGWWSAL